MKKFISILGAAALTASAVVVPVTAGAEGESVLYSDSMNGYATSVKSGTTTVFAVQAGTKYSSVQANEDWQWIFNSPASRKLGELTVGFDGSEGDDTAAIMIKEKEDGGADKYLSIPQNRFQSRCKPQISGFDGYTAKDGEDLVIAFDLRLTPGLEGSAAANPSLSIDGIGTVSLDNISADAWVPIKAVTSDGMTTIYVNGKAAGDAVEGVVSVIKPTPLTDDPRIGDGNAANYATVDLDNIVVFSAADGVNAQVPEAESHTPTAPGESEEITIDVTSPLFDFETDNTVISAVDGRSMVTSVVDGASEANSAKVLSIAGSSNDSGATKFGYSTIDLSEYTAGKARVIVEYDAYITNTGRMTYVLMPSMPAAYSDKGIFMQGLAGGNSATAAALDEWIHTKVDVNFKDGTGTYEVTKKADGTFVAGAKLTTDAQELKYLAFLSWASNTSYIDNLQIQSGGSFEVATPAPATPEPAATAKGSGINLAEGKRAKLGDFSEAQSASDAVLNHEDPKTAVSTTSNTAITAYSADARGNSVYAAYDILVNAGDKFTLAAYGNSGKALGPQFHIEGKTDGTVVTSYELNKGAVAFGEGLVCGTWYRVIIEIPQTGTSEQTVTGDSIYSIYRIDPNDCKETVGEPAVQQTGIGARNLSERGLSSFAVNVVGEPKIDNGVVYLNASTTTGGETPSEPPVSEVATPEPEAKAEGSGMDLYPANAVEKITDAFKDVEGASAEIKNHRAAKPAQAGDISAYSDSARGYSIFAEYDVYVKSGDKLTLAARNKDANKLGPQFVIKGNEDGTATAAYIQKDTTEISLGKGLVNDTWYRVVIEVPQLNNEGMTDTGKSIYSIYRIDPNDCSKKLGTPVVQASGIGNRNLSGNALTVFTVTVEGTPAIDNGVVYRAKSAADTWYRYHFTSVDGIKTVTSIEVLTDVAGKTDKLGKEYYIWNGLMQPYVEPAAEETPSEATPAA